MDNNENLKRNSFIFYRSFKEAISEVEDSDKLAIYEAISDYALDGIETNLIGCAKALFLLIKPQINANNKRFINGCKGGAPKGNINALKQPKNNQKTT